jgi:hypothetical protein
MSVLLLRKKKEDKKIFQIHRRDERCKGEDLTFPMSSLRRGTGDVSIFGGENPSYLSYAATIRMSTKN